MSNLISRRQALQKIGVTAFAFSALTVTAPGSAVNAASALPGKSAKLLELERMAMFGELPAIPVGPIVRVVAGTAGRSFLEFLREVGADFVAGKLNDWIGRLTRGQREEVDKVNTMLNNAGFMVYGDATVHTDGGSLFTYVAPTVDNVSVCTPFLYTTRRGFTNSYNETPMFEGPENIALAETAKAFSQEYGIDKASLKSILVPSSCFQSKTVGFEHDDPMQTYQKTAYGWVGARYESDPEAKMSKAKITVYDKGFNRLVGSEVDMDYSSVA